MISDPGPKVLSAAEVKDRILRGGELALLDLREEGAFGNGHLLFAVPMPLSRLEFFADDLLPRLDVPIVLCAAGDGDDELIRIGAERLAGFGYSDISYLDGGLKGWAEAGFEVFTGVNVPSKAFGEVIEARFGTPHVKPVELQAMKDRGEDMVIVDSRPMSEFTNMSIPGGIDVPGAELVLRIHDIAPGPETTVVVNCAGRTRSIIGAQSLINAGIPNPVVALENGTMGWHLAGLDLDRGRTDTFPALSGGGLARAEDRAGRVAAHFGVADIDSATLDRWRADETRTLYILDVRGGPEFEAGHLADAKPAPGGQLVQATDRYVGVRGARLVLVDDNGVRAKMTASWLVQMGWDEVYVLQDGLAGGHLITGPHQPQVFGLEDAQPQTVGPKELTALMVGGGAFVVDLTDSRDHRIGHIPGARFAIRASLPGNLANIPDSFQDGAKVALTSPDGVLARLAAADAALPDRDILVLAGGTQAWADAGLPMATGLKDQLDEPVDVWYRPYDLDEGNEAAMETYLSWEVDLTEQIVRDGTTRFPEFPAMDTETIL